MDNISFLCFRMVDIFLVESPATSLAFSPTGDFLASSHVDDLGVYLWSNKTLYSHVSLRPLPPNHTPLLTELPTNAIVEVDTEEDEHKEEEEGFIIDTKGSELQDLAKFLAEEHSDERTAPLSDGLVTLSTLPKSRWHNLQNLDVIKQRNKPIEPAKQPKQAPFFLPTLPGIEPKFIPAAEDEEIPSAESGSSRILNLGKLQPLSEFQKCLVQCASTKQCKAVSLSLSLFFKANDDEIVIPV